MGSAISPLLGLAIGLTAAAPVPAGGAGPGPGPATAALYTASDFPELARGVEPGWGGGASVHVWAPSQDEWSLTRDGGTLTLHLRKKPGDLAPGWQSLGRVEGAQGQPIKIIVSDDRPQGGDGTASSRKSGAESKARKKSGSSEEPKRPSPVPALLWLAAGSDPGASPELDLVRGRIETVEPSPDRRRSQVRTNREGADFQAPASAVAWRDRAVHLREQMLVALGLWPMFPRTPLNPKVYGPLRRDGYTIEKVVLETFPGFTLSGNLYRPSGSAGKVPGLLCPHGHWADGRVNPEVQQRCIRWAKLGCVVFMYDMVGYNDSKPFPHSFLNDRLRRWGLSLPTLQTWDSIRALDWLTTLPDVDPARIGCTGESGGGTQTFLLTALDDRIKVAAPVVMVSDTFQGGCVCENAAGLRLGTDNVEFAALCAPRPLLLVGATGDWTARTMERAFPAIRGVYSLVGSVDRVGARVFDFPHNYNQTSRNAVYAGMGRWLLGVDDPARTREGTQQPEKPEDLFTFDQAHPAPPGRKTPEQLEAYLIETLRHLLDDLAPSSSASRWEAARRLLLTGLKVRTGVANPTPEELVTRATRRVAREGLTIVHSLVGRAAAGDAVPVVRLTPAYRSGRLTVLAHRRGKAGLATASGEPAALARALLARGQEVVGFDPLFVGESLDPRHPVPQRPEAEHFETYNPAMAADQLQDLATVLAWARAQPEVREVGLVAQDLAGLQALVARPALEGLARTAIELADLPRSRGRDEWPATIDLPGLEQFGGVKAAAALAAPAPLWLYGHLKALDVSWPRTAYDLAGAPHLLRMSSDEPGPEAIARWIDQGE
jgi:hypothetical protein